ncbi:hypothetical protein C7974DRAFT_418464 [Boeremia exigua]|uniref:uncharacterized protein n=1 Tax=Boeremia exigua TaxID=749465 RepID=UPI001E8EA008|nr:uncharacterized protein C7974DRAFT_418464 [Boeremia exigua]KAH6612515.1 hypothetical protein C7974DRAFT_418464 [Boeremia exigua]
MPQDRSYEEQPLRCMANYYDHGHANYTTATRYQATTEGWIPSRMANYTGTQFDEVRMDYQEAQIHRHPVRAEATLGHPDLNSSSRRMHESGQTSSTANDVNQQGANLSARPSFETQSDDVTRPYRPHKYGPEVAKRFRYHLEQSRFYGWRVGVLLGSCVSTFVLICNIAMIIVGAKTGSGYDGEGVATLMAADEETISRWNTICHVFINILSTVLLSASNYTMQVLNSPTRREIDVAHLRGRWLDIGLVSIHNLRVISRKRAALCLMLAVSSLPLHLFYNAAIFKIITLSKYDVLIIQENDPILNKTLAPGERLDHTAWKKTYENPSITRYSDLYLTIDQISFVTKNDLAEVDFSIADHFPRKIRSDAFVNMPMPTDAGWIPFNNWTSTVSNKSIPDTLHIVEGWATRGKYQSRIQISLPFMIVVVAFNFFKLVIMVGVLTMDSSEYLVTLGDAAASYLEHPEDFTKEKSILELDKMLSSFESHSTIASRCFSWQPRRRRYCSSIGYDKTWSAVIAGTLLVIVITLFPTRVTDLGSGMWQWGSASSGTISFGATGASTKATLWNAWLANMPQVLLSLCYINLNAICTAMASTAEWDGLATTKKGLRVTRPRGKQRSTYFLQLPYKWATPLMMTSGGLHWLLSQTFFISRLDYYNTEGGLERWTSACGISFSGLIVFCVVCVALVAIVRCIGRWPMMPNLPLAENCSIMISAACHPDPSEVDPHLKKVQWGVIPGTGRCSLSSKPTMRPQVGETYS